MRKGFKQAKSMVSALVVCASLGSLAIGCTVRTPPAETPIPSPEAIDKSFFVDRVREKVEVRAAQFDASGKRVREAEFQEREALKPKSFLCGWAPITETGAIAQAVLVHGVHMAGHCNIEFEIAQDALIGRLVSPTHANDRSRWKQIITIPISSHYYLERSRDSYGRETADWVENSGRSDWSARPKMKLDLSGIRIHDNDLGLMLEGGSGQITSVGDIEWDHEKGFLGFTVVASSGQFGAHQQGRFRFNFLAFKHNPDFKRTPYHSSNARFLNALHIMGERVEGVQNLLYAARWDTNKKHQVSLHGFPAAYVPFAKKVIDSWNDVFEKEIGVGRPFELRTEPLKYGFDLRYPSMYWIQDPEISLHSPLGVGMALADVRNGEILWGGITLYGGMLEAYVKAYLGPEASEKSSVSMGRVADQLLRIADFGPGSFSTGSGLPLPATLSGVGLSDEVLRGNLAEALIRADENEVARPATDATGNLTAEQRLSQRRLFADRQARQIMGALAQQRQASLQRSQEVFQQTPLREMYRFPLQRSVSDLTPAATQAASGPLARRQALHHHASEDIKGHGSHSTFCMERRLADVGPSLLVALAGRGQGEQTPTVSYEEGLKKVILELIMHEFGHFIGLGHQFKENIMPEEGTLPSRLYKGLREKADLNMTNTTSVMGYKHPVTELLGRIEDVRPGIQDVLVLRYLYRQEFPTFARGSTADSFTFAPVPANGVIPERHPQKPELVTSYMPQCNDIQASLSMDPYCNRFDRGISAESIVKSYFDDLNVNLIARIYNFAEADSRSVEEAEGILWWRALSVMGRIRLFYDHMRQRYASVLQPLASDTRDLYEFSRVCSGELPGSARLQSIFSAQPELKELCRVNRMAILEFQNFLTNPGPDFSRVDYDRAFVPGGLTGGDARFDYSRAFGTRTALSVLPLKYSALHVLTTSTPYMFWGPWMMPIPRYSGEAGAFAYSTFYPYEFTQAMAEAVEKNLRFGSAQGDGTNMGRTVFAMGHFLQQTLGSNDANRFDREYIENLRSQTGFSVDIAAIILEMKTRDDKTRVTHMESKIFDFRTGSASAGGQAFLLPGGRVIMRAPSRSFMLPFTKFNWLEDGLDNKKGYVLVYRIQYDVKEEDVLAGHSVKAKFEAMHTQVVEQCLKGANNGLASFFNGQEDPKNFPGFEVLPGAASDREKQIRFLESIKSNFDQYYRIKANTPNPPTPQRCEDSVRGLGLLITSAAMINGFFLPEALDYLTK
jgi:hypothetical protein